MPRQNHHPRKPPKPSAGRSHTVRARQSRPATTANEHSSDGGDRLQKVLAAAGIASRRECEELILEGRVEVDRHVVTELGTRVDPDRQEIRVDGEVLHRSKLAYFAVNKPTGVVATASDPAGRPRVTDLLPPNTPRVYCVGRLDISSEGLILVTNDGELANGLTHPRHGVEKIYHIQVVGQVEPEVLKQLHRGVRLAEGYAHAKHVRIKSRRKTSTLLEMVLDEGRNREVRRLLARVGHKVQRLKRIAVGPVRLGDLPTGAVRPLSRKEIDSLQEAVASGLKSKSETPPKQKQVATTGLKNRKKQGGRKEQKERRTVIG